MDFQNLPYIAAINPIMQDVVSMVPFHLILHFCIIDFVAFLMRILFVLHLSNYRRTELSIAVSDQVIKTVEFQKSVPQDKNQVKQDQSALKLRRLLKMNFTALFLLYSFLRIKWLG